MTDEDMTVSDGVKLLKERRNELKRLIELQQDNVSLTVPIEIKDVDEALGTDPTLGRL